MSAASGASPRKASEVSIETFDPAKHITAFGSLVIPGPLGDAVMVAAITAGVLGTEHIDAQRAWRNAHRLQNRYQAEGGWPFPALLVDD